MEAPDPIVGMAYAAGRTTRLKFGMSVLVLPGRNPVVLAKELATLSVMSGGRLLPAFGLGVADGAEHQAFGVRREERARWFDEALSVMRACWRDDVVDHDGERFHYEGLRVQPKPKRLDVWLGGIAPSELRRVGRLADGWLPSFVTPADAAAGRAVVEQVAAEHDRSIEEDHYGVLIPYAFGAVPDVLLAQLARRRPDLDDPAELIPVGWDALGATIKRFVDVGTTKFVVLPIDRAGRRPSLANAPRRRRPRRCSPSRREPGSALERGHRRVATGDPRHPAAATSASPAHEHVGVRRLDAPAALVRGLLGEGPLQLAVIDVPAGESEALLQLEWAHHLDALRRQQAFPDRLGEHRVQGRQHGLADRLQSTDRGPLGTAGPAGAARTLSASVRRRPASRTTGSTGRATSGSTPRMARGPGSRPASACRYARSSCS